MKTATYTAFLLKVFPLLILFFSATVILAQDTAMANLDASTSTDESIHLKTSVAEFTSKANPLSLQEYISTNLEFPSEGREKGLSGTVTVRFEILADGDIGTVVILDSPGPSFDESVKKFLSEMPLWTPASQNSVAVTSVHQLDLNFRLR